MSLDPAAQAHALGLCLAAGVLLGLFYDLIRPLRLLPLSRLLAGLADLAFWAAAALLLFACALVLGDGRVRLYMAAGVLAGAAAYFLLLSPPVRRVLDLVCRLLAGVCRVLAAPVRFSARQLKKSLHFEKKLEKTLPFSDERE